MSIRTSMNPPACPVCPGRGLPLGQLGSLRWYRCRDCGIDFHRRTKASAGASRRREHDMSDHAMRRLRELAEPIAVLSAAHLTARTRQLLQENRLSVNAYPTPTGGFVYVGSPRYDTPLEADLAHLFEVAERAGIVWLKFAPHGTVIPGIETFGELEATT